MVTEGWFFVNGFTEHGYEGGYTSNTISGANPYTLYAPDQVKPSNRPGSWSMLNWASHPHPRNNIPSQADMKFATNMCRPFYVWGWSGNINDEYIINGMYYQKFWLYLKYGL